MVNVFAELTCGHYSQYFYNNKIPFDILIRFSIFRTYRQTLGLYGRPVILKILSTDF